MKVSEFTFEFEGAPPGLNQMLKDSRIKRGVVYNEKKKDWEWIIRAAITRPWPKFKGPVAVEFIRGWCGQPLDMDNVSPKYILDALARMGVIEGDDPKIVRAILLKQKRYSTRDKVRSSVNLYSLAPGEAVDILISSS